MKSRWMPSQGVGENRHWSWSTQSAHNDSALRVSEAEDTVYIMVNIYKADLDQIFFYLIALSFLFQKFLIYNNIVYHKMNNFWDVAHFA